MQWLNVTTDFLNYINTLKLLKKLVYVFLEMVFVNTLVKVPLIFKVVNTSVCLRPTNPIMK